MGYCGWERSRVRGAVPWWHSVSLRAFAQTREEVSAESGCCPGAPAVLSELWELAAGFALPSDDRWCLKRKRVLGLERAVQGQQELLGVRAGVKAAPGSSAEAEGQELCSWSSQDFVRGACRTLWGLQELGLGWSERAGLHWWAAPWSRGCVHGSESFGVSGVLSACGLCPSLVEHNQIFDL